MKRLAAAALAAMLCACGGGDPEDEPMRDTQPVNCSADPKLCA